MYNKSIITQHNKMFMIIHKYNLISDKNMLTSTSA